MIQREFPPIERPQKISLHGKACRSCAWTLEELADERGPLLSEKGLRWLIGELGTLSVEGLRWVMPSYLEYLASDSDDGQLRDSLAYHWAYSKEGKELDECNRQLASLTSGQIQCIVSVLRHNKEELNDSELALINQAIRRLAVSVDRRNAEQDGGGQPATRPESK